MQKKNILKSEFITIIGLFFAIVIVSLAGRYFIYTFKDHEVYKDTKLYEGKVIAIHTKPYFLHFEIENNEIIKINASLFNYQDLILLKEKKSCLFVASYDRYMKNVPSFHSVNYRLTAIESLQKCKGDE